MTVFCDKCRYCYAARASTRDPLEIFCGNFKQWILPPDRCFITDHGEQILRMTFEED